MLRTFLAAIAAGALVGASSAAQAFCGFYAGKADASLFNRASQVILARDGQRTVISMQNDYQGPLTEFALVVPTPEVILPGHVKVAERDVFARLDAFSSPRLAEYHDADPCRFDFAFGRFDDLRKQAVPAPAAASAAENRTRDAALGVSVAARFTLDEYDIVLDSMRDCLHACDSARRGAVGLARHYYRRALPERAARERETLAQLTGWSAHELDAHRAPRR